MEKYKAKSNGLDETKEEMPEKSEKQKKQEATEKTVDAAATVALDAYSGGAFSTVKDNLSNVPVVGKAVDKKWNKAVSKVSKVASKTQIGDASKALDDAGVLDIASQGVKAYSSLKNGNMNENTLNNTITSTNSTSGKNVSKNSSSVFSTNSSAFTSNIIPTFKISKKSIIVIGVAFFVLLILVCAVAAKDERALALTNNFSFDNKTSGGSRNCTTEEVENRLIYVGDSRAVGMESALNKSNIKFIAKVGMGHHWLINEAIPELEKELEEKTNAIVILSLGYNDSSYSVDKYIKTYKELIDKHSSIKFFVMSVNPMEDAKAAAEGYEQTTAKVEEFNNKMKENFSDIYIDVYSSLTEFKTFDGVHYDNDTSIKIHELAMSKLTDGSILKCGGGGGNLLAKLEELGTWYSQNVNTYQTAVVDCGKTKTTGKRKKYANPYTLREYGDDCTEFTAAYMDYVCGMVIPESWSGGMVDPNGSWAKSVEKCGWIAYTSDEIDELQPGDILISHNGYSYSTKGQHGEVYIDESHSFGWGSRKCAYPSNKVIEKKEYGGHVHFLDSNHDYITIYRYEGDTTDSNESSEDFSNSSSNSNTTTNLNITKMNDSTFNHGTKPKSNQKYIMLHDTEMKQDAKTVVQAWKNAGSGVAAHFVIDRDGTIVQAVDLDTIAHHAGYGGPGNYDAKFGVGNNDGNGNGDDLVGRTKLSGYTSYGMNSYSVGIEMCHVNGEDYPEAQLEALDKLIAHIDKYFGKQSTIIDHKAWRPSNSDTDTKFATYFANYKTKRTHK